MALKNHFSKFSSHAVTVRLDLVSETLVQVGQRYRLNVVVLAVYQSGFVPDGINPSLKDNDVHRNII